jgi:transposase-like protein
MAELQIVLEDNIYKVCSQDFYLEFAGGCDANQKALILFLRSFKKRASGRHGLFSQEQLAKAIPDFKGESKQSIQDHERRFAESGQDMQLYLSRKRKVDEQVVDALSKELEHSPFAGLEELAAGVNQRLSRSDISAANIRAGLEALPCLGYRKIVCQQLEKGEVYYQESYLLEQAFEVLEERGGRFKNPLSEKQARIFNLLEEAGCQVEEESSVKGMKISDVDKERLEGLCDRLSEISEQIQLVIFCVVLYANGIPLRVLGNWLGVHKSTVLRWIMGMCEGLWGIISQWICQSVKGRIVYLDEKWIKIKGVWHYWFVALDGESELPIVQELMKKRTYWNCLWVIGKLKEKGFQVKVFITDGLKGYPKAIARVFKEAIHQLCLFHQQQNTTKFAKNTFTTKFAKNTFEDQPQRSIRQKAMKKVFQTNDKRTVNNRLKRLEKKGHEWGIEEWLKGIWQLLPNLLPAIGSLHIPKTNNVIERFFRAFNRFYKVRKGFHSPESAKRQFILFLVFYVFTQNEQGIAPIEKIMPHAKDMPLYRLMNNPLLIFEVEGGKSQASPTFAEKLQKEAA